MPGARFRSLLCGVGVGDLDGSWVGVNFIWWDWEVEEVVLKESPVLANSGISRLFIMPLVSGISIRFVSSDSYSKVTSKFLGRSVSQFGRIHPSSDQT